MAQRMYLRRKLKIISAIIFFLTLQSNSSLSESTHSTNVMNNLSGEWSSYGGNIHNTGFAKNDILNKHNVHTLEVNWVYQTTDDGSIGIVSTPPAIVDDVLYFTSFDDGSATSKKTGDFRGKGALHAVDAQTGKRIWKKDISGYSDKSGCGDDNLLTPCRDIEYSRNTPAIWGPFLVIGTQNNRFENQDKNGANSGIKLPGLGAYLLVINRFDGSLYRAIQIDDAPMTNITQSPIVFMGIAIVSTASLENGLLSVRQNYECCKHSGSVSAVNILTGDIIWQTSMVPGDYKPHAERNAKLYSGASSWGSTPVIDLKRGLVYVTTGNNYNVPKAVDECAAQSITNTKDDLGHGVFEFATQFEKDCNHLCIDPHTGDSIKLATGEQCHGLKESDNHPNSIVALDLFTGHIRWTFSGGKYDPWSVNCLIELYAVPKHFNKILHAYNENNCDSPFKGPDNDFSMGVTLVNDVPIKDKKVDLLIAGQKSGTHWAINAESGKVVWKSDVDTTYNEFLTSDLPLVLGGGAGWSVSTDGKKVYAVEEMRKRALSTYSLMNRFPIMWMSHSEIRNILISAYLNSIVWGRSITYKNGVFGIAKIFAYPFGKNTRFANYEVGRVLDNIDKLDKAAPGSLQYALSGYWYALDIQSGEILWQFAPNEPEWQFIDKNNDKIDDRAAAGNTVFRATLQAGTVVTNGVVFGAATDPRGTFRALDADTGEQIWQYSALKYIREVLNKNQSEVVVNTPPTVVNDRVYWGVGYTPRSVHIDTRIKEPYSNLLFSFKLRVQPSANNNAPDKKAW